MYVIPYSCRYLFIENLYFKKNPDYMETENKVVIFTFRDSKYNSKHSLFAEEKTQTGTVMWFVSDLCLNIRDVNMQVFEYSNVFLFYRSLTRIVLVDF